MVTLCLVKTALCGYPLCSVLLWAAMVVALWRNLLLLWRNLLLVHEVLFNQSVFQVCDFC